MTHVYPADVQPWAGMDMEMDANTER
jgi:hypothetical protein